MHLKWRVGLWGGVALVVASTVLRAQAPAGTTLSDQGPSPSQPPEAPAKKAPGQPSAPQIYQLPRVEVRRVTTPVTVLDSGGQYVYDLVQDEFKVYDNGEPQKITDFDSEMRRMSLVIVVEANDTTAPFLGSVHPLGSMFSDMVMGPQGKVAVITYSDHVEPALDFTAEGDKLDTCLRGLRARGGGMHLDDALGYALSMLDHRPISDRKVAIIFSDGFNAGSKMSRGEIVKRAMNSDILVYGLGFSPIKGLLERPEKDPPPDLVSESVARSMPPNSVPTPTASSNMYDTPIPLLQILLGLGEEAKKTVLKSSLRYFAQYSGGNYYQKWGKDTVQEALNHIATEIHSQYELAYSPSNFNEVGFHTIKVEVRRPGAKVRARAGWFYQGEPAPGAVVK